MNNSSHKKHGHHGLMMIIGCGLPILALVGASLFGFESNLLFGVAIVAMIACHVMMLGGHGGHQAETSRVSAGDNTVKISSAKTGDESSESRHSCH